MLYQNKIIMIDTIKQEIGEIHNLEIPKGIFISWFDEKNNIIVSNGVLTTDKPLGKVIEMIYHGLIEKHTNIRKIICDIVLTIEEKHTLDDINNTNLNTQGLCIQTIDNSKSGILLPWTLGINNIQEACTIIKNKNHIEGNINIYGFTTHRIEIK
jgi:hypothetical protein